MLTSSFPYSEKKKFPQLDKNGIVKVGSRVKGNDILVGKLTPEPSPRREAEEELLSFENILEDVRLTLSINIKESGAAIKSEINVSEIYYSRRKLRSIIYNLVNNAIKFRSPDHRPEIFIKTEKASPYIIISVKDNGIGIDKKFVNKLFGKFYRVPAGDLHNTKGLGLGLYFAHKIIEAHKGKIIVNSIVGIGTEFKIVLPAD